MTGYSGYVGNVAQMNGNVQDLYHPRKLSDVALSMLACYANHLADQSTSLRAHDDSREAE